MKKSRSFTEVAKSWEETAKATKAAADAARERWEFSKGLVQASQKRADSLSTRADQVLVDLEPSQNLDGSAETNAAVKEYAKTNADAAIKLAQARTQALVMDGDAGRAVSKQFDFISQVLSKTEPAAQRGTVSPTLTVAPPQVAGVPAWSPGLSAWLAEMLTTEASKLPNFRVLESTRLAEIRDARPEAAKGKWQSADYTLRSTVTRFGPRKTGESEVQIDWRIVNNATREIVVGGSGRSVGVEKGPDFDLTSLEPTNAILSFELMESALGRATLKALNGVYGSLRSLKTLRPARESLTRP